VGALVQQVGEVLGRAHSLFGGPGAGGVAALDAGSGLAGAGDLVRRGQRHMTGLSGTLPANYTSFASDAVQALDVASGTETQLSGQVHDAGGADRSGWARSAAVVNGAATDTIRLAPVSGTPAGQRALIATLGARVAQQQQNVNAYKVQDARRAAVLRSLAYGTSGGGRSGGMPMGATLFGAAPAGGRPGGGGALSGLGGAVSALAMFGGQVQPQDLSRRGAFLAGLGRGRTVWGVDPRFQPPVRWRPPSSMSRSGVVTRPTRRRRSRPTPCRKAT
jgi:peptidoglycan DL-endopeptidase CwlO